MQIWVLSLKCWLQFVFSDANPMCRVTVNVDNAETKKIPWLTPICCWKHQSWGSTLRKGCKLLGAPSLPAVSPYQCPQPTAGIRGQTHKTAGPCWTPLQWLLTALNEGVWCFQLTVQSDDARACQPKTKAGLKSGVHRKPDLSMTPPEPTQSNSLQKCQMRHSSTLLQPRPAVQGLLGTHSTGTRHQEGVPLGAESV